MAGSWYCGPLDELVAICTGRWSSGCCSCCPQCRGAGEVQHNYVTSKTYNDNDLPSFFSTTTVPARDYPSKLIRAHTPPHPFISFWTRAVGQQLLGLVRRYLKDRLNIPFFFFFGLIFPPIFFPCLLLPFFSNSSFRDSFPCVV